MEEKMLPVYTLEEKLLQGLQEYGFKKKRKGYFIRKIHNCIQDVTVLDTRIRNKQEVHVTIGIGFVYEKVNKMVFYLRNMKYDSGWGTGTNNLGTLIANKKPYGFDINCNTEIDKVVDDILYNVKRYAFDFWEECDTLDKFKRKLEEKDNRVYSSTYSLFRPEWNLLAAEVLLNGDRVEKVIDEYLEFFNKEGHTKEQLLVRIKEYYQEKNNES